MIFDFHFGLKEWVYCGNGCRKLVPFRRICGTFVGNMRVCVACKLSYVRAHGQLWKFKVKVRVTSVQTKMSYQGRTRVLDLSQKHSLKALFNKEKMYYYRPILLLFYFPHAFSFFNLGIFWIVGRKLKRRATSICLKFIQTLRSW